MDGRFNEQETGAEYFVRELPDGTVAWVGEHVPRPGDLKAFTNVFLGRRVGSSQVQGDLIDVPKGRNSGFFPNIQVELSPNGYRFNLPGVGRRTLVSPDTDLPSTNSKEWGAGFYDEAPDSANFSLTGVWSCNDGGTYYLRQIGERIVWFGEHPSFHWSNIFFGRLNSSRITGRWIDVPKGQILGGGEIELQVSGVEPLASMFNATRLTLTNATGGFGGRLWHKTDSIRVAFRLQTLRIVRNADVGGLNSGGDEPYLLPVYITVGGNQYTDPIQLLRVDSGALPSVTSPLFQHEWGTTGDWPKNNLTWQEDLAPGTIIPIPDFIAYGETELRTLRGLEPNSQRARESAVFVPGIVAMEEASTRNEDIRAGYNTLLSNSPLEIHRGIVGSVSSGRIDLQAITRTLSEQVLNAVRASAVTDLFGILGGLDPDKPMGTNFTLFSLGTLRDAALRGRPIPVTMSFAGGAGGAWTVTGTVSGSLGPSDLPPRKRTRG